LIVCGWLAARFCRAGMLRDYDDVTRGENILLPVFSRAVRQRSQRLNVKFFIGII
jgi:hypothetical protein